MSLSWVEIDLAALRHNFFQVQERTGPNTRILGVVKSDAYGHGMIPVARELSACGVHFFAVSKFWEAQELRADGLREPILVLLGVEPEDMEAAVRQEIRPAVFRLDHAKALSDAACRLDRPARLHIKVDTGMGRLGVPGDRLRTFVEHLRRLPGLQIEGLFSHFAVADEADKAYCTVQVDRFREAIGLLDRLGQPIAYAHIANSAGIVDLPQAHFQLVRPGIMLYGSQPSSELHQPADLRPVMAFKSKIIQLKEVPAGHPIGYGCTFVAARPSRIATIPVGYDDGYPRLLSNQGELLIGGARAPLVGRVSMSMVTADVTHIPAVREDDEVVLLGAQGGERITAEAIAGLSGTISYEIYCSIGRHRAKRFLNAASDEASPRAPRVTSPAAR